MGSAKTSKSNLAVRSMFRGLWRGDYSLPVTFFGYGVIGVLLITAILNFVSDRFAYSHGPIVLILYILLSIIISIGYLTLVLVGIWRSADKYRKNRMWPFLARFAIVVVVGLNVTVVGFQIYSYSIEAARDPGKTSRNVATWLPQPTIQYPFTGFWKNSCTDDFGLVIAPLENGLYSVSFCGPGGCFPPGTYRPSTRLVGDSNYQIIDKNTIDVTSRDGKHRYYRC